MFNEYLNKVGKTIENPKLVQFIKDCLLTKNDEYELMWRKYYRKK